MCQNCESERALRERAERKRDEAVRYLREAFVRGAQWWEFKSRGATMWNSDRRDAEDAATEEFPNGEWVTGPLMKALEDGIRDAESALATEREKVAELTRAIDRLRAKVGAER